MDPHLLVLLYLGRGEAVVVSVLEAGKGRPMKPSGMLLLLLLAMVLWGRGVHGRGSPETWVEAMGTTLSCTLDVVLVTFKDTTGRPNAPDTVQLDYHLHDLPYNYSALGVPTDSSYKRSDFERLFNGGYGTVAPWVGDTVTVANSDTLPQVFGSVRAYYDSMSLDPQDRAKGETRGKFSAVRAADQRR